MKYRLILILCAIAFFGAACSTVKTIDPNYAAYQQAMMTERPLVSITWDETGQKMTSLTVNQPIRIEQKQPDAAHPAWQLVNTALRVTGTVFGIREIGNAMTGIADASKGSYAYESGNDMAVSGSSVANPVTTETVTTHTESVTGATEGWTE